MERQRSRRLRRTKRARGGAWYGDWSGTVGQKLSRMGLRHSRYWAPNSLAQKHAYEKKHYDPVTGVLKESSEAWDPNKADTTAHAAFTLNQIESSFFELYKTLQRSQNFGNVQAFEFSVKHWVNVINSKISTYKRYNKTSPDFKIQSGHYYGLVFKLLDYLKSHTIQSVLNEHVSSLFNSYEPSGKPAGPAPAPDGAAEIKPAAAAKAPGPAGPSKPPGGHPPAAVNRDVVRAQVLSDAPLDPPPVVPPVAPPDAIGGFVILPKSGGGKSRRRR